ncbi:hypothetical protein RND71_023259 [Anisodus tanguticus]|uniref:Uncharacterized protein n=1 Tax=Anisodus tanguticus TaxID=243964 RepID=A0AAE1RUT6_9SOLA|nr:hypothetical protein RND71_023259 [Anisodus tanguticus]
MQVERSNKQAGGFMTTKFALSFCKTPQNKVEPNPKPKVTFTKPAANLFVRPEGKVYNTDGGDKNVDAKATSYISLVKERLRLEEMMHAGNNSTNV